VEFAGPRLAHFDLHPVGHFEVRAHVLLNAVAKIGGIGVSAGSLRAQSQARQKRESQKKTEAAKKQGNRLSERYLIIARGGGPRLGGCFSTDRETSIRARL